MATVRESRSATLNEVAMKRKSGMGRAPGDGKENKRPKLGEQPVKAHRVCYQGTPSINSTATASL